MKIDLDARRIVLGMRDCPSCDGTGQQAGRKACPKCHGTARTKGGKGKGRCTACFEGSLPDRDHLVMCRRCDGTKTVAEDRTDYCDALSVLPIRVYRQDRGASWNESFLGIDCVYSCSDYGRAWGADDADALVADVREHGSTQACKVLQNDVLANHIGVFVTRSGYSVRAVFGSVEAVAKRAASEPSVVAGRIIGAQVCADGGNGTLAAAGM